MDFSARADVNLGGVRQDAPWLNWAFFFAALAIALFGIVPLTAKVFSLASPSYFYPYFQIDYFDFGFVRRGLVGTLTGLLNITASDQAVVLVYAISVIATTGVITAFTAWATRRLPFTQRAIAMGMLLLSPATFMHWGFDPGRLDILCFGFVVLAVWSLIVRKILAATAMIAVAALIHEASLILAGPVLAAIGFDAFTEQGRSRTARLRLVTGAGVLGMLFLMLLKSSVTVDELQRIPDFAARSLPLSITDPYYAWVTPLQEASRYSLCTQTADIFPLVSVGALLLFAILHVLALFPGQSLTRIAGAWLTLAAPIAMWVITIDHGRYFSWAIAMLLVYRLALLASDSGDTVRVSRPPMIGLWAMMLLGPIGIVSGFKLVSVATRLLGAGDMDDLFAVCELP